MRANNLHNSVPAKWNYWSCQLTYWNFCFLAVARLWKLKSRFNLIYFLSPPYDKSCFCKYSGPWTFTLYVYCSSSLFCHLVFTNYWLKQQNVLKILSRVISEGHNMVQLWSTAMLLSDTSKLHSWFTSIAGWNDLPSLMRHSWRLFFLLPLIEERPGDNYPRDQEPHFLIITL